MALSLKLHHLMYVNMYEDACQNSFCNFERSVHIILNSGYTIQCHSIVQYDRL